MTTCPFCGLDDRQILASNRSVWAIADAFPVNPGHTLVVTKRHVEHFFVLSPEERADVIEMLATVYKALKKDHKLDGVNVGMNVGDAAGQTVKHAHVHVIPRFRGDVEDPRGGVRGVVPARRLYPGL